MIFILGARSLHRPLEFCRKGSEASGVPGDYYSGLGFNPKAVNKVKTGLYLFSTCFKSKRDLNVWHEVVNNSLSKRPSKENKTLTEQQMQIVLTNLRDRKKNEVYCKRQGVPDIFENL